MLTAEQHAKRRLGVGASDVGAILGLSRYKTPLDVYMEKLGLTPPSEDSEAAEWGHRLEPVIAQKYAAQHPGVLLDECDTVAHPEHPWALATPDRRPYTERDEWLLEIKTREDRTAGEFGEPGTDQVPYDVLVQCQWQMFVTGLKRCDVALLVNGRRFSVYTIAADAEAQHMLYEQVRDFWHCNVLQQVPPEVIAQDNPTMAKLFPRDTAPMLDGDVGDRSALAELATAKQRVKEAEKAQDELEAKLKMKIGPASGLTFPDGSKVTWTRNKDSDVIDWKAVAMDLAGTISGDALRVDEVLDTYVPEHTKPKPGARVLRITVKES